MSEVFLELNWILDSGKTQKKKLLGRNAWAMYELFIVGEKGCTPINNPAPAWAAYVQNLRRMGFDIETIIEPHDGPFKGHHGRYVLRSNIEIIIRGGLRNAA